MGIDLFPISELPSSLKPTFYRVSEFRSLPEARAALLVFVFLIVAAVTRSRPRFLVHLTLSLSLCSRSK